MSVALIETNLGVGPLRRGKVRDIYDLGETLLIVATDRISAFDVVNPTGIPDKGKVLTGLTLYWFEVLGGVLAHGETGGTSLGLKSAPKAASPAPAREPLRGVPHHLVSSDVADYPPACAAHASLLAGRSMLVKKAEVLPVECVVRGYLAGSGWREYVQGGRVCGVALPPGLREADRLPRPIFTPTTKAEAGHDLALTFDEVAGLVGRETAEVIRARSLALYERAAEMALARGIIIADTKFEWGRSGGDLILVDEVLTPDSSRFWPAERYEPGRSQPSFDKQPLRDWLQETGWNKQPPAPALPEEVVRQTRRRYVEAYERLTGRRFTSG